MDLSVKQFGQGTGGYGRAFAQEDSNLTARKLFLPEKYPSPITTDRVSYAGGIADGGPIARTDRLTVEVTAVYPTQQVFELCGKSAWCNRTKFG